MPPPEDERGAIAPYPCAMVRVRRGDVWITAAVAAVQVVFMTVAAHEQTDTTPLDGWAYALIVASALPLLVLTRAPIASLAGSFVFTAAYWATDYGRGPIFLALTVALIATIRAGHRLVGWTALVVGFAVFLWLPAAFGTGDAEGVGHALGISAWLFVLGLIGEGARVRRERGAERARVREEEARRRIGEERLRISRELHDVLAHNVSLINVQSSVALHLLDEQPEQARAALTAIKAASAETLREMRGVLGALREDGESLPRDPAPSLARLDELLAQVRSAGVSVDALVEGEPGPLPAGVDLAAYRIVQEALTNVRRHAPGASARVRVAYLDDGVEVEVDDDGVGGGDFVDVVAGNGLTGMRERAAALDGSLETGAGPRGGFRVLARLPVAARAGASMRRDGPGAVE
jgi:signal transduction histidine kinase